MKLRSSARYHFATIAKSQEQPSPQNFVAFDEQQQREEQQQQQQEDPLADFVDPYKDIDIDVLPEESRNAITASRTTLQNQHKELKAARGFQSKYDQAQQQLQQAQQQLEARQQQANQQNQQNQPDPVEQLLRSQYEANGYTAQQVDHLVKVNLPIMKGIQESTKNEVLGSMQPLVASHLGHEANLAWSQAQQNDPFGLLQNPELAQAVWDTVEKIAPGQKVTPELIHNFARMKAWDIKDAVGQPLAYSVANAQTPQPSVQPNLTLNPMRTPNPPPNQSTRFTYPGGNAQVIRPSMPNLQPSANAETMAAVLETTKAWPKPKGR